MSGRLESLRRSAGLRHGLVMTIATFVAGGLDYLFNVLTGRWLDPVDYGIFISVTAILQVVVHATNVIRNVVARYMAELAPQVDGTIRAAAFLQRRWRWSWRWGMVATGVMLLLSPLLATLLQLPASRPLWAASLALLFLFLRPVTDGALQGLQQFTGLGAVQVVQALLRLLIAAALIGVGWQATGALLSLPLAMGGAMLLALWLLAPYYRRGSETAVQRVSWNYSAMTLAGLLALALLVNMDAIVVKLAFSPEVAGNYGPVVTLGKINLFVPLAMGLVLFPKAAQRQVTGRDPRPVLLLALAATLLPGLALTLIYFLFPAVLVVTVFTAQYTDPGPVLGLVGLATTLYAAMNIWLNYALSLNRPRYVYLLLAVVALQAVGMGVAAVAYQSVLVLTSVMAVTGLLGNLAGAATMLAEPN